MKRRMITVYKISDTVYWCYIPKGHIDKDKS